MNGPNVIHGHGGTIQCFQGTVRLNPVQLIGATTGTLETFAFRIPIRQIPGSGAGFPLSEVDGQFVEVCGQFVPDRGGLVLAVLLVEPAGSGSAGTGATRSR